ncbi:MAG: anaerobic ribonucleoside-triphosphate reductase activating protein [Elusimicrobia bacterium]|nr:anaerobic ribonucleoside-triphosphate reductase activating protein [Elusimicrobiota bacterium]
MRIRELLKFNLIDYPGKISAVVFVPGCNYSCPACHAKKILNEESLIKEDDFFKYLGEARQWVNGVVLCGGEPTLEADLIPFARKLAAAGIPVKLDTNGSSPEVLERLLNEKLINYAAMDVKGPPRLLGSITGTLSVPAQAVKRSIRAVAGFPDYEYRTTIVPVIRDEGNISFLTPAELSDTARMITETTGSSGHKYYIQKFVPRKDGLLDKRLESFPETPLPLLEEMKAEAAKYLPECEIR